MPAAALAQPLGISVPKTNAQLPFPMLINGHEVSATGAEVPSIRLRDPGFSGPSILDFTIYDHTNAFSWIAKQQQVIWYDQVGARYLFFGYIKELRKRINGPWVEIDVSCVHRSEELDFDQPTSTWDAGAHTGVGTGIGGPEHTDRAQIQSLLGNFGSGAGAGGYIQVLNASMPASIPTDRSTLRNAISQVLSATGVTGAVFYIDDLGRGHTMAIGDIAAPFAIVDTAWDGVTTCPAVIEVDDQGAGDVDALWVNGGTAAATGPVYAWQCGIFTDPRSPLRWATLDAPQAADAASMIDAATLEFQTRQNLISVTLTVTGYDGWAKGQLVTVTNAALGWSSKQFTISAVDMTVLSGKGTRQYKLAVGSDPVLFTARLKYLHAKWLHIAAGAGKLRGKLGGS